MGSETLSFSSNSLTDARPTLAICCEKVTTAEKMQQSVSSPLARQAEARYTTCKRYIALDQMNK